MTLQWLTGLEPVFGKLGAFMLAAEALVVIALICATWLLRRDLVQSRAVVLAVLILCFTVLVDRGLAAMGVYPPGQVGQLVVAMAGLVVVASSLIYHSSLGSIPREEELARERQLTDRALREASDARMEQGIITAQASQRDAEIEALFERIQARPWN